VGDPAAVARRAHDSSSTWLRRSRGGSRRREYRQILDSLVDLSRLAYGERGERFLGGCHRRLLERRQ